MKGGTEMWEVAHRERDVERSEKGGRKGAPGVERAFIGEKRRVRLSQV